MIKTGLLYVNSLCQWPILDENKSSTDFNYYPLSFNILYSIILTITFSINPWPDIQNWSVQILSADNIKMNCCIAGNYSNWKKGLFSLCIGI